MLTRKADGKTYLVGQTPTDGVLTGKMEAIVDEAGCLTQPKKGGGRVSFHDGQGRQNRTGAPGGGREPSYYLQELAAPENYYLNTELVWLTVAAGDDSQKAVQVDQRKYQLKGDQKFSRTRWRTAALRRLPCTTRPCGRSVSRSRCASRIRRSACSIIPAYGTYFVRETAVFRRHDAQRQRL